MLFLLIDTAAPQEGEFLIWVILNKMLIKQPWFRLYERRNLVEVFAVLWVNLLETKCYFWQLGQMRKSDGKRGADNCCSLWAMAAVQHGLLCIQRAPRFCVSAGQEKHLTWHLEMLGDSLWRPERGRKEPMMLSQTCVLNAREPWPQR